jgi:hypothetical protein
LEIGLVNVKAVKFLDVDKVRLFEHGRGRRRGGIGTPRWGVREMLEEDTLTTAHVQDL